MNRAAVKAVPVPEGGLAEGVFQGVDYADAFAVAIPLIASARALAESVFASAPWWVAALMALRNTVVRPLGLVASSSALARAAARANGTGDRIGIFPVLAAAPDEVLLGLDDRHLDFRISVRTLDHRPERLGVVSTLVRFHGALGRVYFLPVRPAHRLIVPAMLRRAARFLAADPFENLLVRLGLADLEGYSYARTLGVGGQGTVCEYRSSTGDAVAVKFLVAPPRSDGARRMEREARALLDCRKLADTFGDFVVMGRSEVRQVPGLPVHYFMMDLARGQSLKDLLVAEPPPWGWREALSMVGRIASALARVHAAGYVHRDLHPGNLFVQEPFRRTDFRVGDTPAETMPLVTILDLGVHANWWRLFIEGEYSSATPTFRPVGAITYASPESLETPREVTGSSDVWALGIILYHLLSGQRPFMTDNYVEKIRAITTADWSPPPITDGTSAERQCVITILSMLLTRDPKLRVPTGFLPRIISDALHYRLSEAFEDEDFRKEYVSAHGDLWGCPRCQRMVRPRGVSCPLCGHADEEWFHWSLARTP